LDRQGNGFPVKKAVFNGRGLNCRAVATILANMHIAGEDI